MSDLDTKDIAETQFDHYLTGAATTYPEDDTWVTDSYWRYRFVGGGKVV